MAYGEAQRKILFFRAIADAGSGAKWNPAKICADIKKLSGPQAYFDDNEQVNRAEVLAANKPQGVRLVKVRRDELPGVDDGTGSESDLNLAPTAGLAEAIHLCLFPNAVIGAEFFYYGPRVSRFERYLRDKLGTPFELRQLVRHDVIEQALAYGDIRLLRVKLNPSLLSQQAVAPANLDGLMKTAQKFQAGVYVDMTLRSEKNDAQFTNKVKKLLKGLKSGSMDPNIFEKLEIDGIPGGDGSKRVTPLDVLSERLYRTADIPYRATRTRELDSGAALSAIRSAYKEVKSEIPKDATG